MLSTPLRDEVLRTRSKAVLQSPGPGCGIGRDLSIGFARVSQANLGSLQTVDKN